MDLNPFGWLSLLPPALAIGLAIVTRRALPSLLAGIWVGWLIVTGWQPLPATAAAARGIGNVLTNPGQARVVLFTVLMGVLIQWIRRSGGVAGFLQWTGRRRWSKSRRGARMMAATVGLGVFVESTITCLVVGTVARPLFDRHRIAREKLAYICDATSAPVCMLIPLNSWGAVVLALLGAQASVGRLGGEAPLGVFLAAVPLNFYALLSVLLVFVVAATGYDIGPMRGAERRALEREPRADGASKGPSSAGTAGGLAGEPPGSARAWHLAAPLAVMMGTVLAGIAVTGVAGVRAAGLAAPTLIDYLEHASGSTAVLAGVLAACAVLGAAATTSGAVRPRELLEEAARGARSMLPIASLLVLALGIGAVCEALGTGPFIAARAAPLLTPALAAPVVFLTSGVIAFATGTSWGTFAIMIPLAVPLAAAMQPGDGGLFLPLVVSAVLGGGVFGDHCSPISDTTVISSAAAGSDHIEHVRTQAPYALAAAAVTVVLYLLAGLRMVG